MSDYRVEAPHFVAALSTATYNGSEIVVKAAPIIKWAVGKTMTEFLRYCLRKRWAVDAS